MNIESPIELNKLMIPAQLKLPGLQAKEPGDHGAFGGDATQEVAAL